MTRRGNMTLRVIGALVALISAGIHLWEYFFNGYGATGVGIPFLINVVAGIVIAILLLTWRHWVPLLLLFGFGVLTLGGFVTAAEIGLFGVHETWTTWEVWAAAVVEAIAIVLGPVIFALERSAGGYRRPARAMPSD